MNYSYAIDISALIWDTKDYDQNIDKYYDLIGSISILIAKLEEVKPSILLRKELQLEISLMFPWENVPREWGVFVNRVKKILNQFWI